MKTYNVIYATKMSYESTVKAKSKKEAKDKVIEVIGKPVTIEFVYEINTNRA